MTLPGTTPDPAMIAAEKIVDRYFEKVIRPPDVLSIESIVRTAYTETNNRLTTANEIAAQYEIMANNYHAMRHDDLFSFSECDKPFCSKARALLAKWKVTQ